MIEYARLFGEVVEVIDVSQLRDPEDHVRLCDMCNKPLTDEQGITTEICHVTDWGLVCDDHLGSLCPIKTYDRDELLRSEWWF